MRAAFLFKPKSTLRPPGMNAPGLFRVDPEWRFLPPSSKAGLSAIERVKKRTENAWAEKNRDKGEIYDGK